MLHKNLHGRECKRGTFIFQQGDTAAAMYFIESGEIEISLLSSDGRKIDLALLQEGASFGEIALLDDGPRTATATATKDTSLQVIDKASLFRVMEGFSFAEWSVFLKNTCQTFRRSNGNLEALGFQSGEQRLAAKLLGCAKDKTDCLSQEIEIEISQKQLADMAGLSRETTNRLLRKFEKRGWVALRYNHLHILQAAALSATAQPSDF